MRYGRRSAWQLSTSPRAWRDDHLSRGSRQARRQPREARPSRKGMRSCVACRALAERGTFVRLVCDAAGEIHVDRYLKAPGRGAHLCYSPECVDRAAKRNLFSRAFSRAVNPIGSETLSHRIQAAIAARIDDGLALAGRARHIRSGAEALKRFDDVKLLILAEDAAADGANRLIRRATACEVPWLRHGDAARLGAAVRQPRRVALGITDARTADRLSIEFSRRDRFVVAGIGNSR